MRIITRFISSIVITAFFVSVLRPYVYANDKLSTNKEFKLPVSVGKVIDSYKGKTGENLYIVLDSHCNSSAQISIKEIIGEIKKYHNAEKVIVGLEGNSGPMNTRILSSMPNDWLKKIILNNLVNKGLINGVEVYSAYDPSGIEMVGIEDNKIYKKDFYYLYKSLGYIEELDELKKRIMPVIKFRKKLLYKKELKKLEELEEEYNNGSINIYEYIINLDKITGEYNLELERYQNINKVLALKDLLGNPTINNKTETIKELKERINEFMLFKEIKDLKERVKASLVEEDILAREIRDYERSFKLLESYLKTEINPKDLEVWQSRRKEFMKRLRGLKNIVVSDEYAKEKEVLIKEGEDNIENFYRLAKKRDELLTNNMLKELKKSNQKNSKIMVIGGFHREGVKSILRAKGISYKVIVPHTNNTNTEEVQKVYIKRIKEQANSMGMPEITKITHNIITNSFLGLAQIGELDLIEDIEYIMKRIYFEPDELIANDSLEMEELNLREELRPISEWLKFLRQNEIMIEEIKPYNKYKLLEKINKLKERIKAHAQEPESLEILQKFLDDKLNFYKELKEELKDNIEALKEGLQVEILRFTIRELEDMYDVYKVLIPIYDDIHDFKFFLTKILRQKRDKSNMLGGYNPDDGVISIMDKSSRRSFFYGIRDKIHELTHGIQSININKETFERIGLNQKLVSDWRECMSKDKEKVTPYSEIMGMVDSGAWYEDMAEFIALYILDPFKAEMVHPNRYAYVSRVIFKETDWSNYIIDKYSHKKIEFAVKHNNFTLIRYRLERIKEQDKLINTITAIIEQYADIYDKGLLFHYPLFWYKLFEPYEHIMSDIIFNLRAKDNKGIDKIKYYFDPELKTEDREARDREIATGEIVELGNKLELFGIHSRLFAPEEQPFNTRVSLRESIEQALEGDNLDGAKGLLPFFDLSNIFILYNKYPKKMRKVFKGMPKLAKNERKFGLKEILKHEAILEDYIIRSLYAISPGVAIVVMLMFILAGCVLMLILTTIFGPLPLGVYIIFSLVTVGPLLLGLVMWALFLVYPIYKLREVVNYFYRIPKSDLMPEISAEDETKPLIDNIVDSGAIAGEEVIDMTEESYNPYEELENIIQENFGDSKALRRAA